jgi:hypothetical protein
MSMKKFNYKHICGLLFLFVVLGITIPTTATASTTPIANGDSSLVKKRSLKERLTPNTFVAQYAGNIGCVSVGLGWESLSKRSLTEALIGYVPHYQSTQSLTTFTLRQYYTPWEIGIPFPFEAKGNLKLRPLTAGILVNVVLFDGDFWTREPTSHYGGSYYRFTTRVRLAFSVGQRLTYEFPEHWKGWGKSAELYYDFSMNELSIVSALPNRRLGLGDILSLGVGARWKF